MLKRPSTESVIGQYSRVLEFFVRFLGVNVPTYALAKFPELDKLCETDPTHIRLDGTNDHVPPTLNDIEEVEVLLAICAHLDSPKDLAQLAVASSSFGRPIEWSSSEGPIDWCSNDGSKSPVWSVAAESARRWVLAWERDQRVQQPAATRGYSSREVRHYDRATCIVCGTNFQVGSPTGSYGHWLKPTTIAGSPLGMYGDGVSSMWVSGDSRIPQPSTPEELPENAICASPNLQFCRKMCEDSGHVWPMGTRYLYRVQQSYGVWRHAQYVLPLWDVRHRWARRMHDVQACRFMAHNHTVSLSNFGTVATMGLEQWHGTRPVFGTAAGGGLLAKGRHRAVFTVQNIGRYSNGMYFGVVRESCDVRDLNAHYETGNSFFSTNSGSLFPGGRDWPGKQRAEQGDRVGLLLDTIKGSLTVFLNDVLLGVMVESGLTERYRWAVCLYKEHDSARIDPAVLPLSQLWSCDQQRAEHN